ncbi:hypothetical protein ASPFODRAFT_59706 [Aspergillus luchuensis CBS 106.47]|uniref:Alpha/beta hydrolase fold-3 domain-containing protein n=2 Tax=Aspergillus kawachii TaxID=1069201 RepID=A0A1M3TKF2_ASPLC|nr:hypothetical protein ASPFODRAFT_59706 [Aspergillus luchuensis CBS 106.47]
MPSFQANLYTTFALTTLLIRTIEYRVPQTLTPGREGDRFIIVSPPDTATSDQLALHYFRSSILTSVSSIRPVPIGAVWHPALPSSKPARVVLHFHGGAYVVGGVRLNMNGWSPSILSDVMKFHVMLPQYRLSMEENASFPAALKDGITAYVYILENLGLEPQNIILSGDLAGGNLVLSMIRYLVEEKKNGTEALPLPAAALLWSPWRVTPMCWKRGHRFLSPLGNGFRTLEMPIFLQAGTEEVFFENQVAFVEEMRALRNDIEFCEVNDAPHDIFMAGNMVRLEKEAEEAMERARTYVNKRVGWFGCFDAVEMACT